MGRRLIRLTTIPRTVVAGNRLTNRWQECFPRQPHSITEALPTGRIRTQPALFGSSFSRVIKVRPNRHVRCVRPRLSVAFLVCAYSGCSVMRRDTNRSRFVNKRPNNTLPENCNAITSATLLETLEATLAVRTVLAGRRSDCGVLSHIQSQCPVRTRSQRDRRRLAAVFRSRTSHLSCLR